MTLLTSLHLGNPVILYELTFSSRNITKPTYFFLRTLYHLSFFNIFQIYACKSLGRRLKSDHLVHFIMCICISSVTLMNEESRKRYQVRIIGTKDLLLAITHCDSVILSWFTVEPKGMGTHQRVKVNK